MTPEEINKINAKNKKCESHKKIFYCYKCGKSREVDYNVDICPVCKSQLTTPLVKERNFNTQPQSNVPKCPTCGSVNIKRISLLNRAVHGYAFGLFSTTARSQFKCKNCGYKW